MSLNLPSPSELRLITQSLAMLDAILCPEWEYRYFSFNGHWGPGEEMASMRNGEGDEWFILFDATGVALKGYAHELATDRDFPQNVQEQVPSEFSSFLNEPAFSMQHATFCFWCRNIDCAWNKVSSVVLEDGANEMLALLLAGPSAYQSWAEDYYEVSISNDAVQALFSHQPLDDSVILKLNPDADLGTVYAEAKEIAYPIGTQ